jgi:thioredoxin reductase
VRLGDGARIAIVGAGPSGLAAAKHALDAGFEVTVFEATGAVGGQWQTSAAHSGIWPGMRTNTSRALTAFSDLPAPADHALHPTALQIRAYLERYAAAFDLTDRIRFGARVRDVRPGWTVDGEPFDAVVVASGRFRRPTLPPGLDGYTGELLHAFDYPGAEPLRDRPTLVYGNGVSGLEIASDLAPHAPVVSAFRKSRYVIQKVVDGVSSDWQWYTHFGALERRGLAPAEWAARQRERIVRFAGDPGDWGAPRPDPDLRVAGVSLCQGFLAQVRDGSITCRPGVASAVGTEVSFTDGTTARAEAMICATGYELDLPYLADDVRATLGAPDLALYHRTFHPDLPGLGVIGQFLLQGPFFPLLELQARWIAAVWSGAATLPGREAMRSEIARPRPPVDSHNALALLLAEALGAAPDPAEWPGLAEALVFGPLLPPRHRLVGPGARPDAATAFAEQVAASPRAPLDPLDVEALARLGRPDLSALIAA